MSKGKVWMIGTIVSVIILSITLAIGFWPISSSNNKSSPAAAEASNAKPGDNGTAKVTDTEGKRDIVPLVDEAPGNPSVDTTRDPMTPASITTGTCPVLEDWSDLVDCVEDENLDWYIKGVNQRKNQTGFGWSDIKRWANATNASTTEVRAIVVFGKGISDKEARLRAAKLVGENAAEKMAISRQPKCFVNTRGMKAKELQDFVYCPPNSRQVRVSLMPAKLDKSNKITSIISSNSGVFVDCINVWWVASIEIDDKCVVNCYKPPKEECPPGQVENKNGVCVTPKSPNKDDYTYPEDKPPAPKPTTPPETTPPPVVTKPTPRPTPPPPNEGGGDDNVGDPGAP